MIRRSAVLGLLVAATLLAPVPVRAAEPHWVGAWTAGQQPGPAGTDQSYRNFIHTSIGGSTIRLRFSNRYGTNPLTLRDITVAAPLSALAPAIDPTSVVHLPSITMKAGEEARSAPFTFAIPADRWLAVSFSAPGRHKSTNHGLAWGLNWQAPLGTSAWVPMADWRYVTGIDVVAPERVSTVVALGDSITDAMVSVPETNKRWPDQLNDRLASRGRFSVVNAAIDGNLVTGEQKGSKNFGERAVTRIDWDVFALPNVSTIIVYEGVNDIGQGVAPADIIEGYKTIIRAAHARGIRVVMATMTPSAGGFASSPTYAQLIGTRNALNAWIRNHASTFEGVVPFSEAVQNPLNRAFWRASFMYDQTHPNPLGMKAMADSIPLGVIK